VNLPSAKMHAPTPTVIPFSKLPSCYSFYDPADGGCETCDLQSRCTNARVERMAYEFANQIKERRKVVGLGPSSLFFQLAPEVLG